MKKNMYCSCTCYHLQKKTWMLAQECVYTYMPLCIIMWYSHVLTKKWPSFYLQQSWVKPALAYPYTMFCIRCMSHVYSVQVSQVWFSPFVSLSVCICFKNVLKIVVKNVFDHSIIWVITLSCSLMCLKKKCQSHCGASHHCPWGFLSKQFLINSRFLKLNVFWTPKETFEIWGPASMYILSCIHSSPVCCSDSPWGTQFFCSVPGH